MNEIISTRLHARKTGKKIYFQLVPQMLLLLSTSPILIFLPLFIEYIVIMQSKMFFHLFKQLVLKIVKFPVLPTSLPLLSALLSFILCCIYVYIHIYMHVYVFVCTIVVGKFYFLELRIFHTTAFSYLDSFFLTFALSKYFMAMNFFIGKKHCCI